MATLRISGIYEDVTNGIKKQVSNLSVTTSAAESQVVLQNIGTSEESITWSDISTPGYMMIVNNDDTNFVEVGFATTVYNMKLAAGQVALFPLNSSETDLFLKADTAACDVLVIVHAA